MVEYDDSLTDDSVFNGLNKEEEPDFPQKREAPDTELTTEREPSNHFKAISPAGTINIIDSQSKIESISDPIKENRKRSKMDIKALIEVTSISHDEASKRNLNDAIDMNILTKAMEDIGSTSQTESKVEAVMEVAFVSHDEASVALYQTKWDVNDAIEKIVSRDTTIQEIKSPSRSNGRSRFKSLTARDLSDRNLSTRKDNTQVAHQSSKYQHPFTPNRSLLRRTHVITPSHHPSNLTFPIPTTYIPSRYATNNIIQVSPRRWDHPSQSYDRIRQHQRGMYMLRPSSKHTIPTYEDDYLTPTLANLRFEPHNDNDTSEKEPPSAQTAVACLLCDANISFVLSCSHPFCTICLNQYVQAQIDLGKSAHIVCPMPHAECGKEILQRELKIIVGKEKFAKIDRFALESATDSNPNLRYCPTPDCPYIAYWEEQSEDGVVVSPKFFCPLCDSISCLKCSISPYHEGVSCDVFQSMPASSRNEQLTRSWLSSEITSKKMRPCRRCGVVVMKKEGGCAKMKCRCGYRFCFVCGVENATCGHTPAHHGFTDNITGGADFLDLKNIKSPT